VTEPIAHSAPTIAPEYRYTGVLAVSVVLLVFVIVAPASDWARAVAVALEAAALLIVVATSRVRGPVRQGRALALGLVAAAVVAAIAAGAVSKPVVYVIAGLLAASIPVTLATGLVRLVRRHGATVQAVSGGLAIYVCVGLVFAWVIGYVAEAGSGSYFESGGDGTTGDRVYYSFTVLTTTGFGDYAAATDVGHALAVVEMLVGQIYLVTVLGILVTGIAGGRRLTDASPGPDDSLAR
jgi:hypothetical protein